MLLVVSTATAQQVEWTRTFDDDQRGIWTEAVAYDESGIYQAGGIAGAPPGDDDGFVRKVDFEGRVLWTRRVPYWKGDRVNRIAVDATGTFISGRSEDPERLQPPRVWVARLDSATGSLVWLRRLDAWAWSSIALHGDGIYRTGADAEGIHGAAFKLDRQGNPVWTVEMPGYAPLDLRIGADSLFVLSDEQWVIRLDFDGHELTRFAQVTDIFVRGFGVDESGVVLFGGEGAVQEQAHDGRTLWKRRNAGHGVAFSTVAFDSPGIVLAGDNNSMKSATLVKLDPMGNELWSQFGPPLRYVSSVVLRDERVFVAGIGFSSDTGEQFSLVARMTQDLPPQAQSLSDIDGDGAPDLAVLLHDSHTPSVNAVLKSSATGMLVRRIAFDPVYWQAQLLTVPDANGNGADELAVLAGCTARTAAPRLPLNKVGTPQALQVIPDVNGNAYPELGVVKADARLGRGVIQVKDGLTGALIGNFGYPNTGCTFRGLTVIPDLNGNGSADVGASIRTSCCARGPAWSHRAGRTGAAVRRRTRCVPNACRSLPTRPVQTQSSRTS